MSGRPEGSPAPPLRGDARRVKQLQPHRPSVRVRLAMTGRPPGGRPPLACKALSEAFARLRYRDTSLLIWQQQQQQLLAAPAAPPPPGSYLRRSRSAWYSQYGNQAVLVRDKARLRPPAAAAGPSRFCALM